MGLSSKKSAWMVRFLVDKLSYIYELTLEWVLGATSASQRSWEGLLLSLSPEPVASNLCKAGFRQFFSAVFLRNLIVRQAGLSRTNPSWSWVYECRGRLAGSNKEFYRCLQITVRSLNQPNPADHHLFINKTLPEAQRIQTIEPKQIQILA